MNLMTLLPAVVTSIAVLASIAGDAHYVEKAVAGATLKITIRQPIDEVKAAEIADWLESTAGNINQVYGRFPAPAPNIIVIPGSLRNWGSDKPVTFGRVTRTNGGTVELFVNADFPISAFYTDWTATHELSHLMLPLLDKRYRWISEGFATYYQNILLSRAGHYTPEYAWEKLTAGFERGRQSRPDLSPNAAGSTGIRNARMKIYWSGAALALLADLELRQRSNGQESLDTVLGRLQSCCLPAARKWSGPDLFSKLDSFLDEPLFMPLYDRYANSNGFPDVSAALTDLGVVTAGASVELSDRARLAALRVAISNPVE